MVSVRYLLLFVVLTMGWAGQAEADIPVPPQIEPPKSADATPLVVYVDHGQAHTRLLIPKRLGGQPSEFQPLPAVTPGRSGGAANLKNRTIVAGLTLSVLLIGGGMVTTLIRRRRGRAAIMSLVAILATLGVYVSIGSADIPPRPDDSRTFDLPKDYFNAKRSYSVEPYIFQGDILIEPVEHGDRVTLVIGRDLAGSFSKVEPPPKWMMRAPTSSAAPPTTSPR